MFTLIPERPTLGEACTHCQAVFGPLREGGSTLVRLHRPSCPLGTPRERESERGSAEVFVLSFLFLVALLVFLAALAARFDLSGALAAVS